YGLPWSAQQKLLGAHRNQLSRELKKANVWARQFWILSYGSRYWLSNDYQNWKKHQDSVVDFGFHHARRYLFKEFTPRYGFRAKTDIGESSSNKFNRTVGDVHPQGNCEEAKHPSSMSGFFNPGNVSLSTKVSNCLAMGPKFSPQIVPSRLSLIAVVKD